MTDIESRVGHTPSGVPVLPVHTEENSPTESAGYPGELPFTRGYDARGYLDSPWIIGQYSGSASPEETNRRFRQLIAQGQTGFSVAMDLPTQMGLDSDADIARGEVGRVGSPVSSLRDVEILLDGIDLRKIRQFRTTANSIGPIMAAMFIAAAEKHGVPASQFRVMLQNDSLKEYVARGTYIFPPQWGLKFSADVIEHCARFLPHWEPITFCGYHLRDSGCDAAQELAIAAANGMAYLQDVVDRGLPIDQAARKCVFFLSAGIEIFEEAAKFRAARKLWSDLMLRQFPDAPDSARRLAIFSYTLGGSLVAQEPQNNIVRVAYAALSAALGGVQTLATSSYDEALGLPSDHAAQISLRTQQILAYETGVTRTVDPLGGSYFVEHLTDQLTERATRHFDSIQSIGGAALAIESGFISTMLEEGAYKIQQAIESGQRAVVGLNTFVDPRRVEPTAAPAPARSGDLERFEQQRSQDLRELRRQRGQREVEDTLREVRTAAVRNRNTIPAILEAVRAYATIGEICDELRGVWGSHKPTR